MEKKDTLSILEEIESGEKSIEDAEAELAKALEESETAVIQPETVEPETRPVAREESEGAYVPTRRERKLALAEKVRDWQPHVMAGLTTDSDVSWKWPWPDSSWQWMWQNFGYPVYINHSIDVADGSELNIVSYQGDLFIRGWDEPSLKINGAIFDARTGQDENIVRIVEESGFTCAVTYRSNSIVDPRNNLYKLGRVNAQYPPHMVAAMLSGVWGDAQALAMRIKPGRGDSVGGTKD